MKFRSRSSPLLFLLLPAFTLSLATGSDKFEIPRIVKNDIEHKYPPPGSLSATATGVPDLGTKDAPVDGLDGKPHKGPFVGDQRKKLPIHVEEILTGDIKSAKDVDDDDASDSDKIQPEDGVMNDPNRKRPEEGTTGTEGGVSEKEKDRKMGEDKKKRPEAPKEAPSLPHGEELRDKEKEMGETTTRVRGAAGLEVNNYLIPK